MSLIHRLYPLLRPLLFQFDAETAHELTVKLLRFSHALGMLPELKQDPATVQGQSKV